MNCHSHRFSGNGTSASDRRVSEARKWVEGNRETLRQSRRSSTNTTLLQMEAHHNAILDVFDDAADAENRISILEGEKDHLQRENERLRNEIRTVRARVQEFGRVGGDNRLLKGQLNMMQVTVRAAISEFRKVPKDHGSDAPVSALGKVLDKLEVCISGQESRQ